MGNRSTLDQDETEYKRQSRVFSLTAVGFKLFSLRHNQIYCLLQVVLLKNASVMFYFSSLLIKVFPIVKFGYLELDV